MSSTGGGFGMRRSDGPSSADERSAKSRRTNDGRDAPSAAASYNRNGGGYAGGYANDRWTLAASQQQQQQQQQHRGGPSAYVHRDRVQHGMTGTSAATPAARPTAPAASSSSSSSKAAAAAAAAEAERERAAEAEYQRRVAEKLAQLEEEEEKTEEQLAEERRKRREAILAKHNVKPDVPPAAAAAATPSVTAAAPADGAVASTTGAAAASAAVAATAAAPAVAAPPAASNAAAVPSSAPAAAASGAGVSVAAPAAAATVDDEYDMFADSPSGLPGSSDVTAGAGASGMGEMLDSYDESVNQRTAMRNAEGYYRYRLGDLLEGGRYRVCGLQGSGVFSTVLRVRELLPGTNGAPSTEGRELVVKLIRSNETMYKAGQKELEYLKLLAANDPDNKKHVVHLLANFMHRNHLCLVFEPLNMDLRKVIKKFGSVGLSLSAVRSYAKQLCIALRHLKKCMILHGDIKPVLVNETMNVVKICDFGSAGKLNEECEITPYLVSRFYRAPEIILGLKYNEQVDLWSVGCCLFELYTGRILFSGSDNNSMLKAIQDVKGRFPKKILMRAQFGAQHFDSDCVFEWRKRDPVTGGDLVTKIRYSDKASRDLFHLLRDSSGHRATQHDLHKLRQLADFIHQCTVLDPQQRAKCDELLHHPFISED